MKSVSIITVNKNNAVGLTKTINSVIKHKVPGVEFIVIDGLSTDESTKVLNDNFSHIDFWISELDNGIYEAMNKGVKKAKNDYLLFLNSGDFLVHNFSFKLFDEFYSDIVIGGCEVSKNGNIIHVISPPDKVTFATLYFTGLPHQSTFIKRELFNIVGLYREDMKYHSDAEFWYRAIILGNATTAKLNHIVSNYNLEGISSSLNKTDQFLFEKKEIINMSFFAKITPDYDDWNDERKSNEVLYWIKSKKTIYNIFFFIYKLAKSYNSFKKSMIFKKIYE